jgi:hypothetical protein
MNDKLNFSIQPFGVISKLFLNRGIFDFEEACSYIKNLRYGRNANKKERSTIFNDNCGTCSTKHALLKQLAEEHSCNDLELYLGIFKMNSINTPKIGRTLRKYNLEYIPEAHNYLKYRDEILDFTHKNSHPDDFINDLMEEIKIETSQIVDFKIKYHQDFLHNWLLQKQDIQYTLNEIWLIREQCIADLSV